MKNKILKWIFRIVIALILLILLAFSGFALGERIVFWSFYGNADIYEKIPGLWEGYVPQGYSFLDGTDTRIMCGYMSNGKASRIYITGGDDTVCVEMKNADGSDYTGHTGGIAVMGDYVYVTAKTGCDIFSLADIRDGDAVATQIDSVETINDPAYCIIEDGFLYVGSFYRAADYETPDSHRMTTPAGDSNTAIISVYKLDPDTCKPIDSTPDLILSTTGAVQGMTFIDGDRIALSTSYGISKSHIYVYDTTKACGELGGFDVDGVTVPLLYLDSACLIDDIVAPPMAEEIIYDDGKIYIMNESACMKYLFGKLTSGANVYGYKYE